MFGRHKNISAQCSIRLLVQLIDIECMLYIYINMYVLVCILYIIWGLGRIIVGFCRLAMNIFICYLLSNVVRWYLTSYLLVYTAKEEASASFSFFLLRLLPI